MIFIFFIAAMPDLIRLVHGNSFGIKKLVREFRLYWRQRTSDPCVSLNDSQIDDEADALDKSSMDTSVVVDNAGENQQVQNPGQKADSIDVQPDSMQMGTDNAKGGGSPDKKQDDSTVGDEETNGNFVSKRQLEMKIMAIAARAKREGNKKLCWYVNDDALKQYNMVDLPMQNSWVYISGDMTKKTLNKSAEMKTPNKSAEMKTPNKSAQMNTPNKSAEMKTPNKSVEKKAAQEREKKAKGATGDDGTLLHKEKHATDAETTPKAGKGKRQTGMKQTPKDQPSIMAFAKKTPTAVVKKEQPQNMLNSTSSKVIVVDVDMETGSTEEKAAQLEPQSNENKVIISGSESSNMEEDCIILD